MDRAGFLLCASVPNNKKPFLMGSSSFDDDDGGECVVYCFFLFLKFQISRAAWIPPTQFGEKILRTKKSHKEPRIWCYIISAQTTATLRI